MFFIKEFFYLIPEIFLIFSLLLVSTAYPLIIQRSKFSFSYTKGVLSGQFSMHFETLIAVLFVLVLTSYLLFITPLNSPVYLFHSQLILSPLTQLFKQVTLVITIFLLIANTYRVRFSYWEEILVLTMFLITSVFFFISANDFLILWLSSELQTFCFIFLVAINRNSMVSMEGAIQFFVYSMFLSITLLNGITELYGDFGILNFNDLEVLLYFTGVPDFLTSQITSFLTVLCYFFFKFSIAPFHAWAIEIFEGAPILLLSFFTTISKIAPLAAFLRITMIFQSAYDFLLEVFFLVGLLSIAVGSFGGFMEVNLKRFLAYSGVNHFGWILLALGSPTFNTMLFALFYFFIYLFISISFLLTFFIITPKFGTHTFNSFDAFSYVASLDITLMVPIILILFSFVGMPPFIGFFQKMAVFYTYLNLELYFIPMLLIGFTAIGAFNYLRILIQVITTRQNNFIFVLPMNLNLLIIFFATSILNLTLFLNLPTIIYFLYKIILTSM